jgi:hypothetical protein
MVLRQRNETARAETLERDALAFYEKGPIGYASVIASLRK